MPVNRLNGDRLQRQPLVPIFLFFNFDGFPKDLYLAVLILVIVGGVTSILTFPTKLTSVVVMATFTSVFGPLLISNMVLAINRLEESKEESLQGKLWTFIKTMALSLANPILIITEKGKHS